MSEKYTITIENFEGPFDLLFHLIEKNKIDIYDIPVAQITDQYIQYLEAMKELDLEIVSEFLVMAATLLHIKSKMLLPKNKEESLEEAGDPREELVQRLLEYKKYKEFSNDLKQREQINQMVYFKTSDIIENDENKTQLIGLSQDDLIEAFQRILDRVQNRNSTLPSEFPRVLYKEKVSVAKKVRDIIRALNGNKEIKFSALFEPMASRIEKIAIFLAVLELIKLKRIVVEQKNIFGDIVIYNNKLM